MKKKILLVGQRIYPDGRVIDIESSNQYWLDWAVRILEEAAKVERAIRQAHAVAPAASGAPTQAQEATQAPRTQPAASGEAPRPIPVRVKLLPSRCGDFNAILDGATRRMVNHDGSLSTWATPNLAIRGLEAELDHHVTVETMPVLSFFPCVWCGDTFSRPVNVGLQMCPSCDQKDCQAQDVRS